MVRAMPASVTGLLAPEVIRRVVLRNLDRACLRYSRRFRCDGLDAFDTRFDFDVPGHRALTFRFWFEGGALTYVRRHSPHQHRHLAGQSSQPCYRSPIVFPPPPLERELQRARRQLRYGRASGLRQHRDCRACRADGRAYVSEWYSVQC